MSAKSKLKEVIKLKAEKGIWMPTAEVLCHECHGKFVKTNISEELKVLSEEKLHGYQSPVSICDNYALTECDKCSKIVQVPGEVAMENNLVKKIISLGITSYMVQTGGGCSACEVPKPDGGFYWITFGDIEETNWLVGSYDSEGEWLDEDMRFNNTSELVKAIKELNVIKL